MLETRLGERTGFTSGCGLRTSLASTGTQLLAHAVSGPSARSCRCAGAVPTVDAGTESLTLAAGKPVQRVRKGVHNYNNLVEKQPLCRQKNIKNY